jgi:uncharacterized protein (DUF2384 family)
MRRYISTLIIAITILAFKLDGDKMIIQQNDYSVVDKLGNIYLIRNDEIEKYKEGVPIKKYSRKQYGNITHVDASNAIRIMLFYKNANKIIFLDNQMSENSDIIDLFKLLTVTATAVCNSSNNQFWVFDANNAELLKISNDLAISSRTGNLNNQMDEKINPSTLKEINNQLYLSDKTHGVFVFDYFGTLIKKIPIKGVEKFDVVNDYIIFSNKKNELFRYHLLSFETQKIDSCIPCKAIYYNYPYIIKEHKDTLIYKTYNQ